MQQLTQDMCLEQSPEAVHFAQWLLNVGAGSNSGEDGQVKLPGSMAFPSNTV